MVPQHGDGSSFMAVPVGEIARWGRRQTRTIEAGAWHHAGAHRWMWTHGVWSHHVRWRWSWLWGTHRRPHRWTHRHTRHARGRGTWGHVTTAIVHWLRLWWHRPAWSTWRHLLRGVRSRCLCRCLIASTATSATSGRASIATCLLSAAKHVVILHQAFIARVVETLLRWLSVELGRRCFAVVLFRRDQSRLLIGPVDQRRRLIGPAFLVLVRMRARLHERHGGLVGLADECVTF